MEDKEKMIANLQDRLQNYLYDVNGDPWRRSGLTQNSKPESVSKPDTKAHDVLFMHDSICHEIDINRLLAGSGSQGMKKTTYTINEAADFLDEVEKANLIILHVGINDLKSNPVETTFPKYAELVRKAKSKADKVLISMLTPSKEKELDDKVLEMNDKIYLQFSRKEGIMLSYNNNLRSRDHQPVDKLFFNNTKLSKEGISILASNLRKTMFPDQFRRGNRPNTRRNFDYREKAFAFPQEQYRNPNRNYRQEVGAYKYNRNNLFDSEKLATSIAHAIVSAFQ